MMTLLQVAQITQGTLHVFQAQGDQNVYERICTDSRKLKAGDLFIALKGDNFDAHDFLGQALDIGASAAVVERFHPEIKLPQIVVANTVTALGALGAQWRKQFAGKVIAVTGSSGKTTVKGFLQSILAEQGSVHATPGNWNNHIGTPLTLFGLGDQEFGVIEIGTSHPGEIADLAQMVKPHVALVNNVMPAHIEGFGSVDAIAREKSAIYRFLKDTDTAVINADDAYADFMAGQTTFCHQLTFGMSQEGNPQFTISAANGELNQNGCYGFRLSVGGEEQFVQLSVPGAHNVQNALAAASCAYAVGASIENIVSGLRGYLGSPGRMQIKTAIGGAMVVDDSYNANPGSVKAAIDYLASVQGTAILVFGDMGELGDLVDQAHREVGEYAKSKHIDALYSVGPKSALAAEAMGKQGYAFSDQCALVKALKLAIKNDVTVLVKGSRSARMEQVVNALCVEEHAVC